MRLIGFLFCALLMAVTRATAAPVDEIEALLKYVDRMDATFVRNGDAHTPKEAEAHLRLKWSNQKAKILTAEDFIRLCGAASSLSGKPYLIRFKDGQEEEAAKVLLRELQAMRSKASGAEKPK